MIYNGLHIGILLLTGSMLVLAPATVLVWLRYLRTKKLLSMSYAEMQDAEDTQVTAYSTGDLPWRVGASLPVDFEAQLWSSK